MRGVGCAAVLATSLFFVNIFAHTSYSCALSFQSISSNKEAVAAGDVREAPPNTPAAGAAAISTTVVAGSIVGVVALVAILALVAARGWKTSGGDKEFVKFADEK